HAHADHFAAHDEIICSRPTAELIQSRFGFAPGKITALDYEEALPWGDHYELRLLPAGHILGSAQIHVLRREDGESLLYTGDFNLRVSPALETITAMPAETLVMETTFGLPQFIFPPLDEVMTEVVKFCLEVLEEGSVPILIAYSLGKAQELLMELDSEHIACMVHPSIAKMNAIYERLLPAMPACADLDLDNWNGQVVVLPPAAARSQAVRKIKNRQTAMLSGWALQPGAPFRYQVDAVFPFSDHADYADLLHYVDTVQPNQVYTVHGFATEFARDLRERGIDAWSLMNDNQLDLPLEMQAAPSPDVPPRSSSRGPKRIPSKFGDFVEICERIAATTGRMGKIDILSRYFQTLSEANLPRAALYLTGKPFSRRDQEPSLQVGWALIRKALIKVSGLSEAAYREISQSQNDAGRTAFLVLEGRTTPRASSLIEIETFFQQLRETRGPHAKTEALAERLSCLDATEARVLVQILTGDLRIGLKEGLVEEALAEAFRQPPDKVRQAHMLTGDLGKAAVLAKGNRLEQATIAPFTPVHCMLASPEPDAEAIWKRTRQFNKGQPEPVWMEEKYDGIRAQLHCQGGKAALFSRDLRSLGAEFPEILQACRSWDADVILDGELIAWAEGKKLTFFDLQRRLGRKRLESDLFLGEAVPVRLIVFDLLWKDGRSLLSETLHERRRQLESLELPEPIEAIQVFETDEIRGIDKGFAFARENGNEGLIIKNPFSGYAPGNRGKSWMKLKKAMATLDVVVVRVEQGHGKRSHVLSDYTFAVRDTANDELVTIGKAYTGLTDLELETLTEHFERHTLKKERRAREVTPNVVLEVAFDSIQASKRHSSGLALRFPRIRAIRNDKEPGEIDTLESARQLAGVNGNSRRKNGS
ncbi:MAG: ATP-dependent DNA ligase, partial [Verrucomicrobiota bacterium]